MAPGVDRSGDGDEFESAGFLPVLDDGVIHGSIQLLVPAAGHGEDLCGHRLGVIRAHR